MDTEQVNERWAPIIWCLGRYEVSDQGRVRSLDHEVRYSDGRVRTQLGRILRGGQASAGYKTVMVGPTGQPLGSKNVHELVLEAFVGPRPPNMQGCHNNGDPSDNRLGNLRWGTRSENEYDKQRHGTNHQRNKTHCPAGHPLEPPNLVARDARRGNRSCLACAHGRSRAAYADKHGLSYDLTLLRSECHQKILEGRVRRRGARRTHCPYGHALAEPNLVPSAMKRGRKECLACSRTRARIQGAKLTGLGLDIAHLRDQLYLEIVGHLAS